MAAAVEVPVPPANPNETRFAELFAFLDEMNGMDFYSSRSVALGKLSTVHYLKIPTGFTIVPREPKIVGTAAARENVTKEACAGIYALNKGAFDGEEMQIKGAFLRLQLVLAGWLSTNYEVSIVDPPVDALDIMERDMPRLREYTAACRALAQVLPVAAEHTFRVTGHHYISGNAADYNTRYARYFAACGMQEYTNFLPPEILYHRVAHWISLDLASRVVMDPEQIGRLPNASITRARAAPAGTAIVATSCAVIAALDGIGLKQDLVKLTGNKVTVLDNAMKAISTNPTAYHSTSIAYGKPPLTGSELEVLEAAKLAGSNLAPVLQGFLDSLPRSADLAMAKALGKHADSNPILRKKAKTLFLEIGKTKAANLSELFNMTKRADEIMAEGGLMEDLD